ncbi:MAG: metalloregulator ArsR/SmtB family transcription factor [Cyanobacteria bacterium J06639_1]
MQANDVATCLEALGNVTRLDIYRFLVRAGEEGLTVGDLQAKTDIPRSTLSHHLHRLINAGLVSQDRHGTTLMCKTNYSTMNGIVEFLTAECCADSACDDVA